MQSPMHSLVMVYLSFGVLAPDYLSLCVSLHIYRLYISKIIYNMITLN